MRIKTRAEVTPITIVVTFCLDRRCSISAGEVQSLLFATIVVSADERVTRTLRSAKVDSTPENTSILIPGMLNFVSFLLLIPNTMQCRVGASIRSFKSRRPRSPNKLNLLVRLVKAMQCCCLKQPGYASIIYQPAIQSTAKSQSLVIPLNIH